MNSHNAEAYMYEEKKHSDGLSLFKFAACPCYFKNKTSDEFVSDLNLFVDNLREKFRNKKRELRDKKKRGEKEAYECEEPSDNDIFTTATVTTRSGLDEQNSSKQYPAKRLKYENVESLAKKVDILCRKCGTVEKRVIATVIQP